ncbi:molybdopterin-dependent oxidoreductase [Xinfangfangia sp. CPCC 101601]|uniref:Molybdopterin-dependent oxidoreductase n=1 Tax=Pseudogemmobacter lacusdianii TaxID=3069608 RepID=A0ABU0W1S5_9RHOB|nr:molybdopterin-dependent oxidoreductase [Xinfangfangia sp. CPCC 101601]MDQ2067020.1 molybdopterin-dependent oxidoreductase [Xinfangfangia sp. CPCC 101601]
MNVPRLETSPAVSDEIRQTTCYMCACRCGINVHMKEGRVSYIEGNRDHPINKGVLCAKGASGIMQVTAPSRLKAPLKRVGPRGSGAFEEITWDEALDLAVQWMKPLRETAPEKLAFFTGRDQSQSLTGWWAQAYGTPNYAAHGGFCSVNMAAGGIYTIGGAFWEFGQPDWERTNLFVMFGVAEDHDSNPIKIGIGKLKERGARVISVNPVRTGYSAVADDWYGITPGTDGLLILSLIHCLMEAGKIDLNYLAQWTNAPMLVNSQRGAEKGMLVKNAERQPFVIDRRTGQPAPWDGQGVEPDLGATWEGHRTVFQHMAEEYLDPKYAPEAVSARVGIAAERIRSLAAELAQAAFDHAFTLSRPWKDFRGNQHEAMQGRPVSFHAMRGISAHSNGFQTARALHLLQIILGSVEAPGGYRLKPPYPKPVEAHPTPHFASAPGKPLSGPHLGYVRGPDDLALLPDGSPARIDKAFTWENPLSAHGLMHMLIPNAHAGDPYRIDTLFLYMANMSWNSSMNTTRVMEMLTEQGADGEYIIPRIIYSDAYASEMVAYADLILPDTTYLERHDCISLLDRPISEPDAAGDAIRWPVIAPDRGVRCFQSVLLDLGARLGLPGMVNEDGSAKFHDYEDYIINHQRRPGVGPLIGFRGNGEEEGRGAPNPAQMQRYIENGAFYQAHIPEEASFYKPWNAGYQDWAVRIGLYETPQPYLFSIWSEPMRRFQLAAEGQGDRQPPDHLRARLKEAMHPLPIWYPPYGDADADYGYTVHALTQRPMDMYHSWGSQNAWLRQIKGHNALYLPTAIWQAQGFEKGDFARVSSRNGVIEVPVAHMAALNPNTVWTWNAIGKRRGSWALDKDAPESNLGFLLNHLISELLPGETRLSNSDPVTGQAAWFDCRVRIERVPAADRPEGRPAQPQFAVLPDPPHAEGGRGLDKKGARA